MIGSGSEGRRQIEQGGVRIDGKRVADLELAPADLLGRTVQVGKRRFVRIVPGEHAFGEQPAGPEAVG